MYKQPKKVGVIGAGYIAVELAGVFNGLGNIMYIYTYIYICSLGIFIRRFYFIYKVNIIIINVFNGLGSDTSLFVRKETAIRNFDEMIVQHLDKNMKHAGMNVVRCL
jgi:pyruvate/2-oxoglutarate dehydrogenase complex dihydrolipoamide dehydrogenase (E3) component